MVGEIWRVYDQPLLLLRPGFGEGVFVGLHLQEDKEYTAVFVEDEDHVYLA